MADRGALFLREVEHFAAWAIGLGCTRMLVTNPYELLRWICWRHERENHKGNRSEHAVVRDDGVWLVRMYRRREQRTLSDG